MRGTGSLRLMVRAVTRAAGRSWGALGLLLLLAACRATGAYPLDFFSEMHYQQSYRSQEPERLSPPALSVPTTATEPAVVPDTTAMQNPLLPTTQNVARGEQLYRVNCQPCHGPQGRGDGFVARGGYFERAGDPRPADLTSDAIRAQSDGQLFGTITNGVRRPELTDDPHYIGMPGWKKLLTAEERWQIVLYLRRLQGQ